MLAVIDIDLDLESTNLEKYEMNFLTVKNSSRKDYKIISIMKPLLATMKLSPSSKLMMKYLQHKSNTVSNIF